MGSRITTFLGGERGDNEEDYVTKRVKQSLDRPLVVQEVEAPRFHNKRQMKVVRLSALRNGHYHLQGNVPGTHFC